MIGPKNDDVMKIVELLEKEGRFSGEEVSLIEEYLSGEVGDEVLEKFAYRDLEGMDCINKLQNFYFNMLTQGKENEARKIEKLFFTIGEASSYELFYLLYQWKEYSVMLEPAKKAAVHAALIGKQGHHFTTGNFERLVRYAKHSPENLKKAMEYRGNKNPNGLLVLLTAYFYTKYSKIEGERRPDEEDMSLMGQYETLVVERIPDMFIGNVSAQEMDEIKAAVAEDRVDDHILNLAGSKNQMEWDFVRILSVCSFVNFMLSSKLKNVVTICLAVDSDSTLDCLEAMDLRCDLSRLAGSFDRVFRLEPKNFIQWAAESSKLKVLKEQFLANEDSYIEYMDSADFDTYNKMATIGKKIKPELFQERLDGECFRQQSKLIDTFVSCAGRLATADDIRKYLSGRSGIEHVYACADVLKDSYYWAGNAYRVLKSYQKNYGYDALSNRCDALLLASNGYSLYQEFVADKISKVDKDNVKRVFAVAEAEGLSLEYQLRGYSYIHESGYNDEYVREFEDAVKDVFREYLKTKREEVLSAFKEAESVGRCFGISVMAEQAEENKETILNFAQDTAKSVKEKLLEVLYEQKGWEEDVVKLLASKKAAVREIGIRVLAKWAEETGKSETDKTLSEKYVSILSQAMETEKNMKVRTLLESVLHMSPEALEEGKPVTQEDLVKELHKGNKKRSLAWAYETPFSKVHKKDGTEAGEEYLQAIFLCYSSMAPCGVSQSAVSLAKELDEREFALYVNELFDKWMETGAESKKRWVLYAAAIHGGDEIVRKLHRQIQEWPQAARGAIASEAVQALALSPRPEGLLIVDGISRKFKFKQVKAAAVKALEFAASQLGITTEELADRIVPNLGFDENMQRIFDYGERKFTVTITTALEIEVFDAGGKKLKNLPAPGKKDDEAKAAAAYEEFKQMKKQMKTTVSSQKMRLEMALSTERKWSVYSWKELFVKNPIMHQFAIGLIWGVYENQKLVSSFRYMEDGSFNTEEEEEFILPEEEEEIRQEGQNQSAGQVIGLVHPIELSEESLKTWKEQLEDYEISQPIEQLDRQVYYRTEEEENQKTLERFGGMIINDLSLIGKMTSQGWYKGSVEDGGAFYCFYREDKELALGAVLYFSGCYVGGFNEDVTVHEVRFFKSGDFSTWSYDQSVDRKSCQLSEIPERYFSEIVLQVTKATASSTERNENWKKSR